MTLYFRSPFYRVGLALLLMGALLLPLLGARTFNVPTLGSPTPLPFAVAVPLLCAVGVLLCLAREGRSVRESQARRRMLLYESTLIAAAVLLCALAWIPFREDFPTRVALRNLVGLIGIGLISRRLLGEASSVALPVATVGFSLVAGRALPDPFFSWLTSPGDSAPSLLMALLLATGGLLVGVGRPTLRKLSQVRQ